MVGECKLVEFQKRGDRDGKLVAIEGVRNIPFSIARIFYIYGTGENVVRGQHANKHSEFVLASLAGSCKVKLFDGTKEETVILDRPDLGLYIPKMVWKDMYDFTQGAVLLALSDCCYDPDEYIRDKQMYLKILNRGGVVLNIILFLHALRGGYGYQIF